MGRATGSIGRATGWTIAAVFAASVSPEWADAQPAPDAPTLEQVVSGQIAEAWGAAGTSGDFDAAGVAIGAAFDLAIAHAPRKEWGMLRDAAVAARVARGLARFEGDRVALLAALRESPVFMSTLALLVDEEHEDAGHVYALADRLLRERAEQVERFPDLAAAICVVHDESLTVRINENTGVAPDAVAIFDHFATNRAAMVFSPTDVPATLAVFMVDVAASMDDVRWSMDQYKGDRRVGNRYQEITYDTSYYRQGTPKKVSSPGMFTLPNIRRYGGVCADQAYFAAQVGKSIGVPTVYVYAQGGDEAHAYVGFVEGSGRRASWNFDAGRYEDYEDVVGWVTDPQTRRRISTSRVALRAEAVGASRDERELVVALADAAARLGEVRTSEAPWPPRDPTASTDVPDARRGARGRDRGETPRLAEPGVESTLLEAGLSGCVSYERGWEMARDLVASGEVGGKGRDVWAGAILKLCGTKYPDFAVEMLEPMAEGEKDPKARRRVYGELAASIRNRPDLSARLRIGEARAARASGDMASAYDILLGVIRGYAKEGPFVLPAIVEAEDMLRTAGRPTGEVIDLWRDAWSRTHKPTGRSVEAYRGSMWFRIGSMYAERLEKAGLAIEADKARRELGIRSVAASK
ncbi:MAG: hypothetical protein RBS39_12595 [Phycisphaerales bacterium]|jgi:hypothetical protein|nr:hypothetical protein [Phycisphaerales bacterium]